jgi:hypothetical protein
MSARRSARSDNSTHSGFIIAGKHRQEFAYKNKKKLPTCKPDPVPARLAPARAAIIYLAPALLQGSSCLPSGVVSLRTHRTSRPRPPVYVAFQHARFTRAGSYPQAPWALTPRFHPHPSLLAAAPRRSPFRACGTKGRAVIFCGTICGCLHIPRRLTGALPCAVRTFLPP